MRTVGVILEAEGRGFISEMEKSEKATDDAATAVEGLGDRAERAKEHVDGLGKSSRTAAQHVDHLDSQIENVNRELKQLAVSFAEAGSAAERSDLSGAIRRTEADLRKLEKSRAILAKELPKTLAPDPQPILAAAKSVGQLEHEISRLKAAYVGARTESERLNLGKMIGAAEGQLRNLRKFGEQAGTSFIDRFNDTLEATGPVKIGATIGAVLAGLSLAPALGATVAAGILGGAGIGGVIGGLTLAKRDSRVKAAAADLGEQVMDSLDTAAGAFVPVTLRGIDKIGDSFERIDDDLTSIFDHSAAYVEPLINGVTGLIENAISGVDAAVAGAAPVIEVLERNLPELGGVIGDVLEEMSDNGPEAAAALEQLFHVIEGGVTVVGGVVEKLTEAYGILAASGVLGREAQETWVKYKVEAALAAQATDDLAGKQGILADETLTAADAAKQQTAAITELNDMLRAEADPLFAFGKAQDKVTEAQAKYTEAVKKHGKNSTEARAATRDLAGSLEDLNDKASEIPTTTDGKLTPAFRRMLEEGDATEDQIRAIERELGRLKGQADQYDGLNARAKFSADTGQAAARVGSLIAQIRNVRSKHISISVGVSGTAALAAISAGRILSGHAEGGPIVGPGTATSDSIPALLSNGEHVWSASEVAAAGGHAAVAAMRAGVMHGGTSRVMPAYAQQQRMVVETRNVIEFAGGPDAFGQLMLHTLRVKPGVRETMKKQLA